MNDTIEFYPMTSTPLPDKSDESFSRTVIIYGEAEDAVELGYFDFQQQSWLHFGQSLFRLKCWSYIPNPKQNLKTGEWPVFTPKGYLKALELRD